MKQRFIAWGDKWWGAIACWGVTIGLVVCGLLAYRFDAQLSGLVSAAMGGGIGGLMSAVLTFAIATGKEAKLDWEPPERS